MQSEHGQHEKGITQGVKLSDDWHARLAHATEPLPGIAPYDNLRQFGVGAAFDHCTLGDFLRMRHPHIATASWQKAAQEGALQVDGQLVEKLEVIVRGGNLVSHRVRDVVEPPVSTAMRLLHEDEEYIAIDKPAPLPVHPSGRFNKHTVLSFLNTMYPALCFKPVHRIDADTTGVLLLARSTRAANAAARCFREQQVQKIYLARVRGRWGLAQREISLAIGRSPIDKGARASQEGGLLASTRVEPLAHFGNDSSLLRVVPRTGRTNQIRLHLASCGHPIIGDRAYGDAAEHPDTEAAFTTGGLCLHAYRLVLPDLPAHPGLVLEAPLPAWATLEDECIATICSEGFSSKTLR